MPINRYSGAYQYVEATTPSSLLTGLGAYWPMDESSDGSGPVSRLDVLGVSNLTDNNTCPSAAGIISNSASFNLINLESLTAAHNANIDTGNIDFTLSMWGYLTNKLTLQVFVNKFNSTVFDSEYSLFYDNTADRITFRLFTAGGTKDAVANNFGSPPTATFFHILVWVAKDPVDTVNIKINDGVVDSTGKNFSEFPGGVTGPIAFGGVATVYLTGRVDEVGFWRRILTAGEITTLYNAGAGKAYPFS